MAHNVKGRGTAVLDTMSGTVSLAQPESIPEGGSPRNQNCTFAVGTVATRRSLQNQYSFQGSSVTKLPAHAVSTPNGASEPWTNPAGVEGASSFATVSFGPGTQTRNPATVVSSGAGIPWNNAQDAASGGVGSDETAVIIGFSITANVVSFTLAPMTTPFVAGQPVTIFNLQNGTYLNTHVLTVLSSGLSDTTFEASFTHADVAATTDAGVAIPSTAFASAINEGLVPPVGQYVAFASPAGSDSGPVSTGGGCFGDIFFFHVWMNGVTGVNGCPFGGGTIGTTSSTFVAPQLPPGAVVQAIIPVVKGTTYDNSAFAFQEFSYTTPSGTSAMTLDGTLQQGSSLGTDLSILSSLTFRMSAESTQNELPGVSRTFGSNIQFFGVAILYTAPSPTPATQLQNLDASDFGFTVGSGALSGVQVNFDAGMQFGTAATLIAQLTLGGVPVGTPKLISAGPWATSYTLGGPTDLWGLSSLTGAQVNDPSGIGIIISGTLLDGSQVDLNNLSMTIDFPSPTTADFLDATQYGFNLTTPVTGLAGSFAGSGSGQISVQLLMNGAPVGTAKQFTLPGSTAIVTFGAPTDTWGLGGFTDAQLNATTFGLRFALVSGTSASIQDAQLVAWIAPAAANFDYVTTFEDSFGNIFTLALDSKGDFWIEDVLNNPNVLTPLFEGMPNNSFASSFTADSRQFIAISNLLAGNYPPQSYGQYRDRVSQVGPGAAPAFAGTLTSGATANITAYSASGSTLTLTAANTFSAAEVVTIQASSGDPLFPLNGLSFNVLGAGLSPTQFEISTSAITGSGSSTATAIGTYTYPIAASPNGITQFPFWNQAQGYQSQFDDILWSAGPGSTSSGNVITIYYLQGSHGLPDANLVAAVQAQKFPVYVYVSGCTNQPRANGTWLVTSVGVGTPPGGAATRWYFTFNINETGYQNEGSGANSAPGQYQMTVATLTTTLPLPGVATGDSITVSGVPVTSWNNTWPIVDSLNSGSYSISQTSMDSSGTATYNWALAGSTSAAPQPGQLVTVTGTLNGNGVFNVTDAVIATVTGSSSGTFTITGFAPQVITSQVESGQATTSGTQFQIDPGALTLNSSDNPIYGNSGGGYVTLVGSTSVVIAPGTRKGTVFFITRNGYWTAPAPPVQFTVARNSNYIKVSNIPIGPPNVIARGIALTEAGQNGQPGASFYTIPEPVQYVFNGITYLSSSLIINDNSTTNAQFTFPDSVLLNAEEIDIQGNDLFNLTELGDSAWCTQYHGRSVWGRVSNKVPNFLNMSFDGGYNPNPAGNLLPLGWGADLTTMPFNSQPTLLVSPIFGNSWYILNQTGSPAAALGRITQSAYRDYNNVAILQPEIAYSVRVTCRTPGGATVGALVVDLTGANTGNGYGNTYGTFTLNTSAMTTAMATYSGTLLTTPFASVPTDLVLRVWAANLAAGGDIEIDRIEIFPTIAPVNLTGLTMSYKNDWESFDLVTGGTDTNTVNAQPANGAFVIHDQLYVVKESSLGYLSDTPNQEPANWNPFREVSNVAGAAGINAFDVGEEWAIMACQNGLYAFNGGAPVPMHQEILEIWRSINWNYGHTICVRNDVANRHILISVPMATPNQWCPDFPVNANPTAPNVVLCLDYKGIETIEELIGAAPIHITMMGQMAVHDLRRKWSLWSITSPYMAVCKRSELLSEMLVCSGLGDAALSSFANLIPGADNGVPFTHSYCTYGFVDEKKAEQNPMLGQWNKRYAWWDAILRGQGKGTLTFFQNILAAPFPWTVPGGVTLTDPAPNDLSGPLNEYAMRLFVEFKMNGLNTRFSWQCMRLAANPDPWQPIR